MSTTVVLEKKSGHITFMSIKMTEFASLTSSLKMIKLINVSIFFRESILNGSPDLKEAAANGLGEVIKLTSSDALKPSVVHITGPLIRILGDRFGANVKTAVLDTLACLLEKAGVLLKPFFPQLQTTFVKALNDPNR